MDTIQQQAQAMNEEWKPLQGDMLAFMGSHTVKLTSTQRLEKMSEFLADPSHLKRYQDLSNRTLELVRECKSQIMKHVDVPKAEAPTQEHASKVPGPPRAPILDESKIAQAGKNQDKKRAEEERIKNEALAKKAEEERSDAEKKRREKLAQKNTTDTTGAAELLRKRLNEKRKKISRSHEDDNDGWDEDTPQDIIGQIYTKLSNNPNKLVEEKSTNLRLIKESIIAFWTPYIKKNQEKIDQYASEKPEEDHLKQDRDIRKKRLKDIKAAQKNHLRTYEFIFEEITKQEKATELQLSQLKDTFESKQEDKIDTEAFEKECRAIIVTFSTTLDKLLESAAKEKKRIDNSLNQEAKTQTNIEKQIDDEFEQASEDAKKPTWQRRGKGKNGLRKTNSEYLPKIYHNKKKESEKTPTKTTAKDQPKAEEKAQAAKRPHVLPRATSFMSKPKEVKEEPVSYEPTSVKSRVKLWQRKAKNSAIPKPETKNKPTKGSPLKHQAPKTPNVDASAHVPIQEEPKKPKIGFVSSLKKRFNK